MFENRLDKLRRNVKKYRDGDSSAKLIKAIKGPLYCCIVLLLIVLAFCIYFAVSLNKTKPTFESVRNEELQYSNDVNKLRNKFIAQLKLSHRNPEQTIKHKILMPENNLFTRTKTIQYLYDYVEAATKQIYKKEYISNPHKVRCIETFDPKARSQLKDFEVTVQQFLRQKGSIFEQSVMKTYTSREIITAENCGGLSHIIGQYGIIASKDIPKFTCIGHYYGDEYSLDEYEAQFPWSKYGKMEQHPFKKKWDYYMTIPYHTYGDKKLKLEQFNITMTMDAFHSYNYAKYVKDGGQDLSAEQSKLKENLEVFVNDARRKLHSKKMSREDLQRKNMEFVYCAVDGILMTFLLATQDIEANQQLFIYYGPNYG